MADGQYDKRRIQRPSSIRGTILLDQVKNRLLVKADTTGFCDPSSRDDLTLYPDWQRHKRDMILFGLLDVDGRITPKGKEALTTGRYRRTSKGANISIALDAVTMQSLDAICSRILMTSSRAAAIRFCVALAIEKLGLDLED